MEKHSSLDDQFISLIHRIIEDNLDNQKFSVNELAEKAGLSRSNLHRKIIKLTGKSSIKLITETRLAKALELLENDAGTASEIAYMVGFSDPNYFYKVFKKYYNISPGEVRKKRLVSKEFIPASRKEGALLLRTKRIIYFIKPAQALILFAVTVIITIFASITFFSQNFDREISIAVLPFENLTGDTENNNFIDGLQDLLISELGKNKAFRVISRQSTLRYRGSNMLLPDIGREIGAEILIEGSFQCLDDNICFVAQGIDVRPKESHVFSNEYYDELDNLLVVQASVVKDIAEQIRLKLTKKQEKRLSESQKTDAETMKIYLEGMSLINKGTTESFKEGISFLGKAINRDPGNARIRASYALAHALRGHALINPKESFRTAEHQARTALVRDPTSDEAFTALALIYLYRDWDWPRAKTAFRNAVLNNPSKDIAHAHFAWYYVQFGDFKNAIHHASMSVDLAPYSAAYNSWLAWLYFISGEYEEAETYAMESLELDDQIGFGNLVMGWEYLRRGDNQKALDYFKKLPKTRDYYLNLMGYAYMKTGNRDKALEIWNECERDSKNENINPVCKGLLAGMLGYSDRAFQLLDEAFEDRIYPLIHIETFPSAEYLRDDPRYYELLQKMNLKSFSGTRLASK